MGGEKPPNLESGIQSLARRIQEVRNALAARPCVTAVPDHEIRHLGPRLAAAIVTYVHVRFLGMSRHAASVRFDPEIDALLHRRASVLALLVHRLLPHAAIQWDILILGPMDV